MTTYLLTTGDDKIIGTPDADTFDETVDGEFGGTDNLSGEDGNDVFMVDMDQASTVDGGLGVDTVILWGNEIGATYKNVEILEFQISRPTFGGSITQIAEFETIRSSAPGNTHVTFQLEGNGGTIDFQTRTDGDFTAEITGRSLDSGLMLKATEGDDRIQGTQFNDILEGGSGNDIFIGSLGVDKLYGQAGDDAFYLAELSPNKGLIDGGEGTDTLYVEDVDLRYFTISGIENLVIEIDTTATISALKSFNSIYSRFDDFADISLFGIGGFIDFSELLRDGWRVFASTSLTTSDTYVVGTINDDWFSGSSRNDTFEGGAGADTFQGWSGTDTVSYSRSKTGVTIGVDFDEFDEGTGDAKGDRLDYIENLIGSAYGDRLYGDDGVNSLQGGGSGDTLEGKGGSDKLFGEDGNDTLLGGAGADYLSGGVGTDTVSYTGTAVGVTASLATPAINTGEAKGDTYNSIENLTGTSSGDWLTGNAGVNTIIGDDGRDTMEGLAGDDKLFGGDWSDTLIGGAGADYLSGGTDSDTASYAQASAGVKVNLTDPSLNTGEAKGDTFNSIENLEGSAFNDTLDGNAGANTLSGLAGLDLLRGAAGNDTLLGGRGNDTLGGGDGNDTLIGGADADYLSGGNGADTASYSEAKAGIIVSLAAPAANTGEAAGDTFGSIENLVGSNFDDMLTGNSVANRIDGGQGNDTIRGHNGNDILVGGDGHDTLNGGTGADSLEGESGTDTATYADATTGVIASLANASINTGEAEGDAYNSIENLTGSAYDDVLNGDSNANTIIGDAGDDIIKGYGGNDKLSGGDGNDTLNGGAGVDYLSGGAGGDTASFAQAATTVKVNLADPSTNAGEAAGDTFNSIENLEGSNFDDTLDGNSAANSLSGSSGNDLLRGAAGNDALQGGTGDDTLGGGDGNDILLGGTGADYLSGGVGSDRASYADATSGIKVSLADSSLNTGAARGDTYNSIEDLLGSDMNDSLEGNSANNRIEGGQGDDLLNGGSGSDHLVGGSGIDTATYITAAAGLTANLADPSINSGEAAGDVYQSIESLTGSAFDDVLTGNDSASGNTIYGASGDDVIDGGGGNFDKLKGGSGNDLFIAGAGEEYFDGGAGHDTVSFMDATAGIVMAYDNYNNNNKGFASGDHFSDIEFIISTDFDDTVHFGGGIPGYSSHAVHAGKGDDVLVSYDGIISLYGEDGNDTLTGGAGGDRLYGGTGIDTASYANASAGVLASLANNSINKGDALGDVYGSIEVLVGSDFDDYLYGNNAQNTIIGGGGHDAFKGYNGDDILIGEAGDDILNGGLGIDELDGGIGLDTASYADASAGVYAALYSPSLNQGDAADDTYISIEGLTGSRYNDTLIGDSATNKLEGLNGDDLIDGGSGSDILTGGNGSDVFVFDTQLKSNNVDVVTDYEVGIDAIGLDKVIFSALSGSGFMSPGQFSSNANGSATDSSDRIIYETDTGYLFYDADGSGAGASVHFATVSSHLRLTSTDFYIYV